jgi:hypothetical protein
MRRSCLGGDIGLNFGKVRGSLLSKDSPIFPEAPRWAQDPALDFPAGFPGHTPRGFRYHSESGGCRSSRFRWPALSLGCKSFGLAGVNHPIPSGSDPLAGQTCPPSSRPWAPSPSLPYRLAVFALGQKRSQIPVDQRHSHRTGDHVACGHQAGHPEDRHQNAAGAAPWPTRFRDRARAFLTVVGHPDSSDRACSAWLDETTVPPGRAFPSGPSAVG